jgi:hypothetical protein
MRRLYGFTFGTLSLGRFGRRRVVHGGQFELLGLLAVKVCGRGDGEGSGAGAGNGS